MTDDSTERPATAKKAEDSAVGCRTMADDDRVRAEASDSDRMRFRLACSAEAWTARADLLERLEANRARIDLQVNRDGANPDPSEENDNG